MALRSSSSTFTKVSLNSINQELFLNRINLENNVIISVYGFSLGMNTHYKFLEYGNLIIKIICFPYKNQEDIERKNGKLLLSISKGYFINILVYLLLVFQKYSNYFSVHALASRFKQPLPPFPFYLPLRFFPLFTI